MRAINKIHTDAEDNETPARTLSTAQKIDNQILDDINNAVLRSKANQKSKKGLSPKISALKALLATAKKRAGQNLDNEEYKIET